MLAALVNAQIKINKQRGMYLITQLANLNKKITYIAPIQRKKITTPMTASTQNHKVANTCEPELLHPDNQWEEEALEIFLRRSPWLSKKATCTTTPQAGISQGALSMSTGNHYMQ